MITPDDSWLSALSDMVESFIQGLGGYQGAGLNVLRFSLITKHLLSPDHSLRQQNYMESADAIMAGMEYLLDLYLKSKPDLTLTAPQTIRASVTSRRKLIMSVLAREMFSAIVDRDGFSESDLKELREVYEKHTSWYCHTDKISFIQYIEVLQRLRKPLERVKVAVAISHSLQEMHEDEKPSHRRLTEFSEYVTGHIETIRHATGLDAKYVEKGYTPGMSGMAIAVKMVKTKDES